MATRGKEIFVTPLEFVDWVRQITTSLHEHVVLDRWPDKAFQHWDGAAETLLSSSRAMFTGDLPTLDGLGPVGFLPGLLGWVIVGVPRVEGSCLFSVTLAARSDWWDRAQDQVLEKKDALRRYDRIWRRWKSHVFTPMLVRHIPTGAAGLVTRVGYSAGAAEWVRQGGILRQEGTANNEYLLPEPAE